MTCGWLVGWLVDDFIRDAKARENQPSSVWSSSLKEIFTCKFHCTRETNPSVDCRGEVHDIFDKTRYSAIRSAKTQNVPRENPWGVSRCVISYGLVWDGSSLRWSHLQRACMWSLTPGVISIVYFLSVTLFICWISYMCGWCSASVFYIWMP